VTGEPDGAAEFDAHADSYDQSLARGLSPSGEDKSYYARGRVAWLARRIEELAPAITIGPSARVLDFGCGDGFSTPYFLELLGAGSVTGVDVSEGLLRIARTRHQGPRVRFVQLNGWSEPAAFDLVFTNGVFHHIPPDQRPEALARVRSALRPGGLFAFWENNPWNPGTRVVMRRIVFDREAITITPPEGKRLIRSAGFEVVLLETQFYFPHSLRWFRPLEPTLARLPLGAQYLILARRP
jgi:SAM-dependent methyltransferase